MTMGLEPMWTDLSDMLATRTDDQLLKWKEVAENPRVDNYRSITTLRQLVVDLYNKSIKDIINELSIAVNDELNSRKEDINMDRRLEARVARLERMLSHKFEGSHIKDSLLANSKDLRARLKNEALKKYLPARYSYDSLEYDINETNSFDINDILAAYARVGQKPKKILKELLASGDIDEWAKECSCSTEELSSSIEESMYDYDDTSSITVEGRDGDTAKCKVVLPDGKAFTVYMPVYDLDEDDDDI